MCSPTPKTQRDGPNVCRGRRAGGHPPSVVRSQYAAVVLEGKSDSHMIRASVFVDGFNLYFGLRQWSGREHLWLDLQAMAEDLLKPRQVLVSVVYFTAMVRNDPDGLKRQDLYHQALTSHCPKVRIERGHFQAASRRCASCGARTATYEEKQSDVSLGVELVEGAANRTFDLAIVVSGDADFVPAFRAARRVNSEIRIISVFPPNRVSDALRREADGYFALGKSRIRRNQLPEHVAGPYGPILKPAEWT